MTVFRFEQIADNIRAPVMPSDTELDRYVGLEHLDPESLKIRRWGNPSDVIGQKLRFWVGDIIYGRRRAYQRKVAVADFDGICSAHALVLRAKPEVCLPEFLPFFLQSELFHQRALEISVGSLSPTINWGTLAVQEFPLPPLDEQRRIADLLWAADKTVMEYQNVVEKLQGVFVSTANDFFAKLRQSNVSTQKLRDLCSHPIVNGIFRRREEFGQGLPLVNVTDIYSGFRINESSLDRVIANQDELERFSAKQGDVIFNRSSIVFEGIGHACLIPETQEPLVFECHLMRVRPNRNKILPEYLARFALSRYGRSYLESVARKTTMTTINQQDLGNMPILLPDLEQQKIISGQLDDIEQKIEEVKKHIGVLMNLKSKMLNRFLTNS